MALIIEDGSGVAGANSFITAVSAGTYLNGRSATWASASTTEQENALFYGGQYLNSLNWKGAKMDRDQSMIWPRHSVYDEDNYLMDYDKIPYNVSAAQVEAAVYNLDGYDLFETVKPGDRIKRKKIDVLEKEFFSGAYTKRTRFDVIDGLLRGLLETLGKITRS
ncbi:MAG: hypothetical protein KAS39_08475 [Actinomycetia bacterium]|nr:hypothetical protein [Actinomycetes bacterium]